MSSRDEGIFLPMREMLDQVVHRFIGQLIRYVCIKWKQLLFIIRHLPEAFGSWKDVRHTRSILCSLIISFPGSCW